jgi:hypothetical protein
MFFLFKLSHEFLCLLNLVALLFWDQNEGFTFMNTYISDEETLFEFIK